MSTFLRDIEPNRPPIDWTLLLQLRLERATEIMKKEGIDGVFANKFDHVIYFSNWPRWPFGELSLHRFCVLYPAGREEAVVFTPEGDAKFILANKYFKDIRVVPSGFKNWPEHISRALKDYGLFGKKVAIDSTMIGWLYENIKKKIPEVEFVDGDKILSRMRVVKNPEEIKAYEFTLSIVEGAINTAIRMCKESWGRYTEIDIAAMATYELLKRGCGRTNIYCPAGENAVSLAHYVTDRPVRGQEFVLVDGGCTFNGFRAEFARAVWTGGEPTDEQKYVYKIIYDSHLKAREIMKPGTMTSQLAKVCFDMVKDAGYEKYYGGFPFTGHGIGITQEAPWITTEHPEVDVPLEPGMIFNLEPAIWMEGVGGIRIEDTYLITDNGYRILSRAPYEDDLLA